MLLTAYCNRLATAFLKKPAGASLVHHQNLACYEINRIDAIDLWFVSECKNFFPDHHFLRKECVAGKVFAAIEAQTGYVVIGSARTIKSSEPVTLQVSQMPLSSFLGLLLKSRPFDFEIRSKTIFIKEKTCSQGQPFLFIQPRSSSHIRLCPRCRGNSFIRRYRKSKAERHPDEQRCCY